MLDSGETSRLDKRRNVKEIRGRCGCGLRLLRPDGERGEALQPNATATKNDLNINEDKRVISTFIDNTFVQKPNDLVAHDHKQTAKKYLDILYNTALLESGYSLENTNDYSMWIPSMLEREIKQIETADNDADDEHIDDLFKGEV